MVSKSPFVNREYLKEEAIAEFGFVSLSTFPRPRTKGQRIQNIRFRTFLTYVFDSV